MKKKVAMMSVVVLIIATMLVGLWKHREEIHIQTIEYVKLYKLQ